MMGDPLGSSHVSSRKQNREGVVGAQSGQYRAMKKSSSGCDNLVSESILGQKRANEDVGGVDHLSLICIFLSLPSTRPFGSSLASISIRTLKLS
ncbi:hypothetical protein ACFX12_043801 [Malus domestica]